MKQKKTTTQFSLENRDEICVSFEQFQKMAIDLSNVWAETMAGEKDQKIIGMEGTRIVSGAEDTFDEWNTNFIHTGPENVKADDWKNIYQIDVSIKNSAGAGSVLAQFRKNTKKVKFYTGDLDNDTAQNIKQGMARLNRDMLLNGDANPHAPFINQKAILGGFDRVFGSFRKVAMWF